VRDPAEVDRLASELIQLSTRHNFVFWPALGAIYRGWARSASGNTAEGIPCIEQGIKDYRATGTVLAPTAHLALKAEALYLADRTFEALEAINEAEAIAERFGQRYFRAELHRLRGVILGTLGAEELQIEAQFCKAIRIAKEQKSVSLQKRAEATYTEYRCQTPSGSVRRGFRLPLWLTASSTPASFNVILLRDPVFLPLIRGRNMERKTKEFFWCYASKIVW
jgi:predicted ATPase